MDANTFRTIPHSVGLEVPLELDTLQGGGPVEFGASGWQHLTASDPSNPLGSEKIAGIRNRNFLTMISRLRGLPGRRAFQRLAGASGTGLGPGPILRPELGHE